MIYNASFKALLSIFLVIGIIWVRSGYGKFASGNFAENLGNILAKNTQSNPFPFYKEFLDNVAIPNSYLFGQLTMWGEILTALAIIVGSINLLFFRKYLLISVWVLSLGLLGGVFLNLNFWFAFSWTSPANDSLNTLMLGIELIGFVYALKLLKQMQAN